MILLLAIFARAIMSWIDRGMTNPLSQALIAITEPFIAPVRSVLPRFGMIDLSPMVVMILIILLRNLLASAAA